MRIQLLIAFLMALLTLTASAQVRIGDPYTPPTEVTSQGDLQEPWGTVEFRLTSPESLELVKQESTISPMPFVSTEFKAGNVRLVKGVFRAPIWQHGVDVMDIELFNTSDAETAVCLELVLPEKLQLGRSTGVVGGSSVLALPAGVSPERKPRDWGCIGGVVSMRGWGQPSRECDPAFRNISAGMGNVPIEYRFRVNPGDSRNVVLGLCESFWGDARQRPIMLSVEGCTPLEFNPIASWGQHSPGCLSFAARDLNGDGFIEIMSSSSPNALDKVPILNVIWIFAPDFHPNMEEVLLGKHSEDAEYYVDVGGEHDQLFFESTNVRYEIVLPPQGWKGLLFLFSSPAGGHVPNPETMVWDLPSLTKAGRDVWAGWWVDKEPSADTMPEQFR